MASLPARRRGNDVQRWDPLRDLAEMVGETRFEPCDRPAPSPEVVGLSRLDTQTADLVSAAGLHS